MRSKIKLLRFLLVILILGTTIAWATETTWRHPGFEVTGFDINMSKNSVTNAANYTTFQGRHLENGGCDASYCIRFNLTNSSIIEAINGSTGDKDYSGTNATVVMQGVQSSLGSVYNKRTVKMIGNFTLSLNLVGNQILDLQEAYLTAQNPVNGYLIETYNSSIDIIGGTLDGNRGELYTGGGGQLNGSVVYIHGLTASDIPSSVNMRGIIITGGVNRGVLIRNLKNSLFENLNITNNGRGGLDPAVMSGAPGAAWFTDNIFKNIILNNNMDSGVSPGISTNVVYDGITALNTIQNPASPNNHANGISLDRGNNITISNCNIRDNSGYGIEMFKAAGDNIQGNKIVNCYSRNNSLGGYQISNSNNTIITGSTSTDEVINLRLNGNRNDIVVSNNLFLNARNESIYIRDTGNNGYNYKITGNTIKNWNTSGLLGNYGGINITKFIRNVTISDNAVTAGSSNDVFVFVESGATVPPIVSIYDNNLYKVSTLVVGMAISKNNYGFAPFNFGNNASAPTAWGAGDIYFNSTTMFPCWRNSTSWNRYNDSVGGC